MQILVMDKDPSFLKQMASLFKKQEIITLPAQSVQEAVRRLHSCLSIGLLLIEFRKAGDDGYKLLQYIRHNLRFNHIPVIICTDMADSKTVTSGIGLGAKDFIVKPISESLLIERVNRILGAGKGTVFIIGIDEITIRLLKRSIELEGYKVFTSKSGKSAISFLEKNHIDVIISDIYLEDMSGLDLLVDIKEKYYQIPMLFIDNQNSTFDEDELISAGADGCIKKPFNNTEIITKITMISKKKRKKISHNINIARKIVDLNVGSLRNRRTMLIKGETK
ncbi:MAG: PleD family two-component system response regulator [Candidatus Zixiibacteriota bacterium]